MKIAVQSGMLPGSDILEKFQFAKACGFQGVEPGGRELLEHLDAFRQAMDKTGLAITSLCAGYRGCLLDPNPAERQLAINDCKQMLQAAGQVGATGLICVPIFGPPRLPDLKPLSGAVELEKDLFVAILRQELAPAAEAAGTLVLVEPLNRYETHLLRRLADAVEIVERVQSPGVALMADFFHMHIEERSTPQAILQAGRHLRHIHLADNTRLEPGSGDTDFVAGFRALKQVGYTGYMALECGVSGDRAETLKKTARFLLEAIGRA